MQRAAGLANTSQPPVDAFKGTCCKMFFPMDETSGPTITDSIGDVVLTPSTVAFDIPNAIHISQAARLAPTSGTFPAITDKSFILFNVFNGLSVSSGAGTVRAETTLRLYDDAVTATHGIGFFDGDGFSIYKDHANDIFYANAETGVGSIPADIGERCTGAIACVRDTINNAAGVWLHHDYRANIEGDGTNNIYPEVGDTFARLLRNEDYDPSLGSNNPKSNYGSYGRNDFNIPDYVIETHQHSEDPEIWTAPGLSPFPDGMPGLWPYMDGSISLNQMTHITFGLGLTAVAEQSHYGLALFVFDNGLPLDWKEALRWMRDQWLAGNKVIWPDWVSEP